MRRQWTADEVEYLRRNYPREGAPHCAEHLGRSLASVHQKAHSVGVFRELDSIVATRKRASQGPRSIATRFKPGNKAWNRGISYRPGGRSAQTQFQRGRPAESHYRHQPIGTLRIDADGYLTRKISDDLSVRPAKRWKSVHRIVWEDAHGQVPRGHAVAFKQGMHTTVESEITIDRLELVSRAELVRRNSIQRFPQELQQTLRTLAKLKRAIKQQEESEQ